MRLETLAILLLVAAPSAAQDILDDLPREVPPSGMGSTLDRTLRAVARAAGEDRAALGRRFGVDIDGDDRAHVVVVSDDPAQTPSPGLIERFGGEVGSRFHGRLEGRLPLGAIARLAEALPSGWIVRAPSLPHEDDVQGEGPQVTNSISYANAGFDGTGRTIGIIDRGYNSWFASQANGDFPQPGNVVFINYTSTSFGSSASAHGTGAVETAYDHCPGAYFVVYKIDDVTDLGPLVTHAQAVGVDVLSMSLSFFNQGWNDNTGAACAAVLQARSAGILFFTSAGNYAQRHYQGVFDRGPDNDTYHNFAGPDETIDLEIPPGNEGWIHLAWSSAAGAADLDLYLLDQSTATVASSTNSGGTFESIYYDNQTASTQYLDIAVRRISGADAEFEVFTHRLATWREHIVSSGSISSPSNTGGGAGISVGAVHWSVYGSAPGTNPIASYSSQGPSNGPAIPLVKPEVCGPTSTTGFAYPNGYGGTSGATPNLAGAACAIWSSQPGLDELTIRWLLREQAEALFDWGAPGPDDVYGKGGAFLVDYAFGTTWVDRSFFNTGNSPDRPYYSAQVAYNATPAGGRLLFLNAGSYPDTFTMTKQVNLRVVGQEASVLGP